MRYFDGAFSVTFMNSKCNVLQYFVSNASERYWTINYRLSPILYTGMTRALFQLSQYRAHSAMNFLKNKDEQKI